MKFALAGNPNSGKTTLFNALTGSTAHVGNWPGVTVDKRVGMYKKLGEQIEIVDLPGIYSMSPYTPEEVVSRNFMLEDKPDGIINIVDVTNLERNLYLTTQLLELDTPIIVALNMSDLLAKSGATVDIAKLEKALGVPCVEISALKGNNLQDLMKKAVAATKEKRIGWSVVKDSMITDLYNEVIGLYESTDMTDKAFHAVKMIENDELEIVHNLEIQEKVNLLKEDVDTGIFQGDYEGVVADARYKNITAHYSSALVKKENTGLSTSEKVDRVMTHRIWSIPIFLLIMFGVFHMTFSENLFYLGGLIPDSFDSAIFGSGKINSPGIILTNILGLGTGWIDGLISNALPAGTWYTGLIYNGIWGGVSAVLGFLMQILTLYFFIAILEDSGYMARVAFILDRAFRRMGLSGKAFMPLVMCFGCAIPGIMGTKTLENDAERRRTIMLTPFFSCGAKLPIWAAFGAVFAAQYSGINAEFLVFGTYIFGIAIAIIASFILKNTIVKGDTQPFIMELPTYHSPQARNITVLLWDKLKHYIKKVTTVIVGAIIVLWVLQSFNFRFEMVTDSAESIIGTIGRGISWLFVPLGFGMGENGWIFVVAAITGLIAKEMVVGTLGLFGGIEGAEGIEAGEIVGTSLGVLMLGIGGTIGGVSVAIPAMLSYMAFNLLSVPCMAAVAAAAGELNSRKHTWITIAFWMITSYLCSLVIFWLGTLIAWNPIIGISVAVALVIIIVGAIIIREKRNSRKALALL